jgi:hypothetical protein
MEPQRSVSEGAEPTVPIELGGCGIGGGIDEGGARNVGCKHSLSRICDEQPSNSLSLVPRSELSRGIIGRFFAGFSGICPVR